MKNKLYKIMPVVTLITYFIMIAVNALANILPINDITTGEVSDKYSNFFAPAPITFSIWGLIYLLLLIYVIYQLRSYKVEDKHLFFSINCLFTLSSIANSFWILAWHYEWLEATLILMFIILLSLGWINIITRKSIHDTMDKLMIRLPFSVYFGWITVATIANITTYLVSIQWSGFGISPIYWTMIIIIIGALIGYATIRRQNDIPYGLVILWAYAGIIIKHTSPLGFNSEYLSIVITTALSMCFIGFGIGLQIRKTKLQ